MKILVTGAAGFLGKALIKRLIAHNLTDIRCNVRQRADIPKLQTLVEGNPRSKLEYCVGNLRHRDDAARAVEEVQLIFHLVAGKKGTAADLFLDSVVASRNLLDAVGSRKPMRIVLVSSFGVYGVAGLKRNAVINENTVLEPHPERRDHYSFSKLRQEQLFWEYRERNGLELVVLRPGVIYGPEGGHFSNRVGLTVGKWQLQFGGNNLLPLSYVDNCAEAIVVAGTHGAAAGQVYNVHDDDLPTCRDYVRAYKKNVRKVRSIRIPYVGLRFLSTMVAKYHRHSKGQLPAILTPYKVASMWGGNRFDNSKLRSIGWKQIVPTAEGLKRSLAAFREELDAINLKDQIQPVPTKVAEVQGLRPQLASDEFVIGAALGPNPNGNFDQLLAAFSNCREAGCAARLIIFSSLYSTLGNKTESQEANSHLQWVSDELTTREALEKCDVLVSLQDGVPLVVLQALSSHIPIITSAVRVPEILRNQANVSFIGRAKSPELQEALRRVLAQPKRNVASGSHGGKNIARQYSDTYLWREKSEESEIGHPSAGNAMIKNALFGTIPSRQLVKHGNGTRAQIAITIDDGPDPVYTPRILDIFRNHSVRATFFVVGGAAEQYPEIILRMKNEGHEVGSHSYSHPYFNRLSWAGANREIRMTKWVLDSILGEECKLFRPPHGKLSLRSLLPAWAAGQCVVLWNVDLKDYRASFGEVEAQLDRTPLAAGDIILYHGINEAALRALPRVIEAALDNGRHAVTISEFLEH